MIRMTRTRWLLLGTALLMIVPLFLGGEFSGADDQATAAIEHARPGYTPWFRPLWAPPSGEVESLLFALQAAIGAGVIGYAIGRRHGRARRDHAEH